MFGNHFKKRIPRRNDFFCNRAWHILKDVIRGICYINRAIRVLPKYQPRVKDESLIKEIFRTPGGLLVINRDLGHASLQRKFKGSTFPIWTGASSGGSSSRVSRHPTRKPYSTHLEDGITASSSVRQGTPDACPSGFPRGSKASCRRTCPAGP